MGRCKRSKRRAGSGSSGLAPFTLDFGAATITVELAELHESAVALATSDERRIILDPRRIGSQNLTATLWHECLHHVDDLFLPNYLNGKDDASEEHKKMDVLANCIDMLLTLNWPKFEALYKAKQRRSKK